jgi:hypothetical protein
MLSSINPSMLDAMRRAKSFPEMGTLAGESQFKVMLDTLRLLGVPHSVNHAPCAGKGAIGKDDAIQQAMLDFGHYVTSHCTTGIDIGPLCFVFFTGASDADRNLAGSFLFTLNRETRKIDHNTVNRKIICKGDE